MAFFENIAEKRKSECFDFMYALGVKKEILFFLFFG